MESMKVDEKTNGKARKIKANVLDLRAVAPDEGGDGLPYAPVWPKPSDVWSWKVGKRIASSGHFRDRFLYPPRHLGRLEIGRHSKKHRLKSKLSVERFIRSLIPDVDVEAFFASFSWKIPANISPKSGNQEIDVLSCFEEAATSSESDSHPDSAVCKAGNKRCNSLLLQTENPSVGPMPCDICCSEPRFCRDCCCILCCKTIKTKHGGFTSNYMKCEASACDGYICGHVAHIDCALRTYMAGTVGGSIGLDVEYYCRRCDAKTDLVPYLTRFIQTCESIDSREEVEEIINFGIAILRGSQKNNVVEMLSRFKSASVKLKCGANLADLWIVEEDVSAISTEQVRDVHIDADKQDRSDNKISTTDSFSLSSGNRAESLKLEDEIDQTLYELRKSQANEYSVAEEHLYAQKNCIQNLYKQLEIERFKLASQTAKAKRDVLLADVAVRESRIKKEVEKLENMKAVAKGFGRTSKRILNEYFGLEIK